MVSEDNSVCPGSQLAAMYTGVGKEMTARAYYDYWYSHVTHTRRRPSVQLLNKKSCRQGATDTFFGISTFRTFANMGSSTHCSMPVSVTSGFPKCPHWNSRSGDWGIRIWMHIVTCVSDCRQGLGLDIGFIEHLHVVTTNNYNTITNFHTLQITTAHTVFSSQPDVQVTLLESESESYVTIDGQSVSLSWNKAPIWHLRPHFYYCHTVAGLLIWDTVWREDRSVVYNCCWSSPAQSFSGPSLGWLVTIFYCLRFDTSVFVASYDSLDVGGVFDPASTQEWLFLLRLFCL
jgi:hypothetical protein